MLAQNIIESNGKTVKENNLTKSHKIKLGSLVEISVNYLPCHKARLFVVAWTRDCDGTPLYSLAINKDETDFDRFESGFDDNCLTIIE